MLQRLRELLDLSARGGGRDHDLDPGKELQLVTAALLLEIARADFDTAPGELALAERLVRERFDLDRATAAELLAEAGRRVDDAVSLHQFTRAVNASLNQRDKIRIVEMMWEVAHADGRVDMHEEHLVRRIADLLHLRHQDFIRARLRAEARAGPAG